MMGNTSSSSHSVSGMDEAAVVAERAEIWSRQPMPLEKISGIPRSSSSSSSGKSSLGTYTLEVPELTIAEPVCLGEGVAIDDEVVCSDGEADADE